MIHRSLFAGLLLFLAISWMSPSQFAAAQTKPILEPVGIYLPMPITEAKNEIAKKAGVTYDSTDGKGTLYFSHGSLLGLRVKGWKLFTDSKKLAISLSISFDYVKESAKNPSRADAVFNKIVHGLQNSNSWLGKQDPKSTKGMKIFWTPTMRDPSLMLSVTAVKPQGSIDVQFSTVPQ